MGFTRVRGLRVWDLGFWGLGVQFDVEYFCLHSRDLGVTGAGFRGLGCKGLGLI